MVEIDQGHFVMDDFQFPKLEEKHLAHRSFHHPLVDPCAMVVIFIVRIQNFLIGFLVFIHHGFGSPGINDPADNGFIHKLAFYEDVIIVFFKLNDLQGDFNHEYS